MNFLLLMQAYEYIFENRELDSDCMNFCRSFINLLPKHRNKQIKEEALSDGRYKKQMKRIDSTLHFKIANLEIGNLKESFEDFKKCQFKYFHYSMKYEAENKMSFERVLMFCEYVLGERRKRILEKIRKTERQFAKDYNIPRPIQKEFEDIIVLMKERRDQQNTLRLVEDITGLVKGRRDQQYRRNPENTLGLIEVETECTANSNEILSPQGKGFVEKIVRSQPHVDDSDEQYNMPLCPESTSKHYRSQSSSFKCRADNQKHLGRSLSDKEKFLKNIKTLKHFSQKNGVIGNYSQRKKITTDLLRLHRFLCECARTSNLNFESDLRQVRLENGSVSTEEIFAMCDASYTVHMDSSMDPTSFLTASAWGAAPGILVLGISVAYLIKDLNERKKSGTLKSIDVVTGSTKMIVNTVNSASQCIVGAEYLATVSSFEHTLSPGVITAAPFVGPSLGVVFGGLQAASALCELATIDSISTRFEWCLAKYPEFQQLMQPGQKGGIKIPKTKKYLGARKSVVNLPGNSCDLEIFDKLLQKMSHRKRYAIVNCTAGLVCMGGGALGIAGTVGMGVTAANIWNPVGWCMVGVGGILGLGVLTYKLKRRYTKREKLKVLRMRYYRKQAIIPIFCKSTGDYHRWRLAKLIMYSVTEGAESHLPKDMRLVGTVFAIILFGRNKWTVLQEDVAYVKNTVQDLGIAGIIGFLKG
ncbi:MAG: hypothetical protein GY710_20865 [Desulfobacteraceae bacterium]|nr:hypothetical protein [Desulfobacteraceae bacterium]